MGTEILSLDGYFQKGQVGSAFVDIENTVKLLPNSAYKSIKNLELNFYYYDYEKETYELIASKKVERTFLADVAETIKVELESIPLGLIQNGIQSGQQLFIQVFVMENYTLSSGTKLILKTEKL
jgi:hypothetical protein